MTLKIDFQIQIMGILTQLSQVTGSLIEKVICEIIFVAKIYSFSFQFFDTIGLTNLSNLWSDIVPRVFAIIQSTFYRLN